MRSLLTFITLFLTVLVYSQEEGQSADDIARELSNPVGSKASIIVQGNYVKWAGSAPGIGSQNTSSLILMPTIPVPLKKGNLIFRPSLPFSGGLNLNDESEWEKKRGISDVGLIAMYGYNFPTGIVLGGGPTMFFPTGSEFLGKEQFQIGPSIVLAFIRKWGVVGGLWQHYFGIGDPPDGQNSVNAGTLQLFYWFGVGNGWQVGGSPNMSANYVNAVDTDFSVPLNLGLAKTVILGKMPLKLTLQGQYFVTRPDFAGPSWGIFFQITPVINLPW